MYTTKPAFVYGFHGIDREAAMNILTHKDQFIPSNNAYDWLGGGIYFWENNKERAHQYAIEDSLRKDTKIKEPFVLGATIDLGNCLDLLDQKYLDFLKFSYEEFSADAQLVGLDMPVNRKYYLGDFDFKKRELDCAVIRYAHELAVEYYGKSFDSVRAAFIEGDELYPGAGFRKQNHIQIAVINPDCIKGIFIPREKAKI
jgi:hypothetical protein